MTCDCHCGGIFTGGLTDSGFGSGVIGAVTGINGETGVGSSGLTGSGFDSGGLTGSDVGITGGMGGGRGSFGIVWSGTVIGCRARLGSGGGGDGGNICARIRNKAASIITAVTLTEATIIGPIFFSFLPAGAGGAGRWPTFGMGMPALGLTLSRSCCLGALIVLFLDVVAESVGAVGGGINAMALR